MVNYHKELVSALSTILPTYYEMALTSGTETPCIVYMETKKYAATDSVGATLVYTWITYQVKIWGNDIGLLQDYAQKIDDVVRPLGFKRIASGELYDNNSAMIQKILTYQCLALEDF